MLVHGIYTLPGTVLILLVIFQLEYNKLMFVLLHAITILF